MAEPVRLSDEQWAVADPIEGWYTQAEADLLYRLCDGPWCEVGCWKGKSTVILAQTGHTGWAVDWFQGSPEHKAGTRTHDEFTANLAAYENVTVLNGRFGDMHGDVPALRFLHLDADHSFAATRQAWDLYAGKVAQGGHVVLHDAWSPSGGRKISGAPWPGVCRFALEMEQHDDWELVESVERSAAFRRI